MHFFFNSRVFALYFSVCFLPLGNLSKLKHLHLLRNNISSFPASLTKLSLLEHIMMNDNLVVHLPSDIGKLRALKHLHMRRNKLVALPDSIGDLSELIQIHANFNAITALPISLGKLQKLRFLHLRENKLTEVPAEIANMHRLEQLEVSFNQLSTLPQQIRILRDNPIYPRKKLSVFIKGNPVLLSEEEKRAAKREL